MVYPCSLKPPPTYVIESGAFRGHSTWLIRTTLPKAKIFSLDPRKPDRYLSNVEYFNGDKFIDFSQVDWRAKGVDPAQTLVFLDDHQSGFRRVFNESAHKGFFRFILEDNYSFLNGDNMSFKWVCERHRKHLWPGVIRDNFGKVHTPQTWDEHVRLGDQVRERTKVYYEFPPVANETLTGQTRFDSRYTSRAVVQSKAEFAKHFSRIPLPEFHMYTHFSYVELPAQTA